MCVDSKNVSRLTCLRKSKIAIFGLLAPCTSGRLSHLPGSDALPKKATINGGQACYPRLKLEV